MEIIIEIVASMIVLLVLEAVAKQSNEVWRRVVV
jgi:hypothetical protein